MRNVIVGALVATSYCRPIVTADTKTNEADHGQHLTYLI